MPAKSPDPLDTLIGENIRFYRLKRRMPQVELAYNIGLTFQQIQKYESGANRVPSSRLIRIARVLEVPISSFFGEAETGRDDTEHRSRVTLAGERQASKLLDSFSKVTDARLRALLIELVEDLATARARNRQ